MKIIVRLAKFLMVIGLSASLAGCDEPQVYGSVGISSGYSSYGGYGRYGGYNSGPRMHGSISVGGRIH